MKRYNIYMDEKEMKKLKKEAKDLGFSLSHYIRHILILRPLKKKE